VIKLNGDVRYTMGCALGDFLNRLFAQTDYDGIIVDLTDAHSIDSTSLGLLARIANFSHQHFAHKTPCYPPIPMSIRSWKTWVLRDFRHPRHGRDHLGGAAATAVPEPCDKDALTRIVYEATVHSANLTPTTRKRSRAFSTVAAQAGRRLLNVTGRGFSRR